MGMGATREQVREFIARHPDWIQQEIARELGVSKQWVSFVCRRDGLTAATRASLNRIQTQQPERFCPECGKEKEARSKRCGECAFPGYVYLLTCDQCGAEFERSTGQQDNQEMLARKAGRATKHIFCGKRCQGKWLAQHNGFGVHPLNSLTPKGYRAAFCLRGHPLSGDNLYVTPRGKRYCRVCQTSWHRDAYRRRKERAHHAVATSPVSP